MESEEKITRLLVRLIKARSYPGIPEQEAAVAAELKSFLEGHQVQAKVVEVKDGRPNLLATVDSGRAGRHLLLCGHTDTVPPNAGSPVDLFSPEEREGRLFGRGACDMKGALAAMAGALADLAGRKPPASGKVTFAAVIDEEMESLGAEALILSGFQADAAIVGEPTDNRIAIGHKGLEWLAVEFTGRAAHGSTPEAGINAISAAADFVRLVEQELVPRFEGRRDPVLGLPVINMGTISGGDQPSTVAAHCEIKLDRRWVTTETIEQVFADLEDLLAQVRKRRPGLTTRISRVPGGMATMIHGPLTIDREHPLVKASEKAFSDQGLPAAQLTVFPAWTDGALLSREAKIPTIIWGPGELNTAHSPMENVRLADVHRAALLYTNAALNFTRIP
jgi:acetylornithine deacetylase/succinyl-diaminopimelate desuccinylase family protein